ncbi:MAG: F0F1 ATP synthase subunit A [Myxococcota bacterium]
MNVFEALEHATGLHWAISSSLFAAALLLASGLLVRARLAATQGGLVPDPGFTLRNVLELLVEMLKGLAEQNMGPHWRKYFPLIGTIFFFILISNLLGLIPGFAGATSTADTTWAWATISFVVHQYVGIREHGFRYVNHFLGPRFGKRHLPLLFWLYGPIELLSHVIRVLSLSLRLLANMFADHMVVGVWLALVPAVVPAAFMGLGVLVAFLQAYVFALLSMIYIGLALEDAH